jgi:hypothetical protein
VSRIQKGGFQGKLPTVGNLPFHHSRATRYTASSNDECAAGAARSSMLDRGNTVNTVDLSDTAR